MNSKSDSDSPISLSSVETLIQELVSGLVGQQAMPDDSWQPPLLRILERLASAHQAQETLETLETEPSLLPTLRQRAENAATECLAYQRGQKTYPDGKAFANIINAELVEAVEPLIQRARHLKRQLTQAERAQETLQALLDDSERQITDELRAQETLRQQIRAIRDDAQACGWQADSPQRDTYGWIVRELDALTPAPRSQEESSDR